MNNSITLRSAFKVKEYHFMPCKQANGLNLPFVKPVRIMPNGASEMILSEAERNDPNSQYFIPEDEDIVVRDGTTFNLDNPLEKNRWLAIKDSFLIVPSRDARDEKGNLKIDGDKNRYGMAELWIDIPGQESEKSVSRKKLITQAWTFIGGDSVDGRLTKCKLLGKNFRNAPSADVEDFLYQRAQKDPQEIINLYTSGDVALKLMFIDARDKNIIRRNDGLFKYGDTILGATEESVIYYFKLAQNKAILDQIKYETYPDYIPKTKADIAAVESAREIIEEKKAEKEKKAEEEKKTDKSATKAK
jgi:hypothetical protein